MSEPSPAPQVCARCNVTLDAYRLAIVETDGASTGVSEWMLCSWEWAREHTIRMVRVHEH